MVILQHGYEPVPGYILDQKLGSGSFGVVWSAHGPGQTRVALKFLNLHHAGGAKEFEAISAIKNVRHPNLLPITGYWLLDSCGIPLANNCSLQLSGGPASAVMAPPETLVIAMVAADRSLDEVLRGYQSQNLPGIPAEELIGYMHDAAKGLDFLNAPRHDLGDGNRVAIHHRDVKPENILVVGDSAVLCDFGVARACQENDIRTTGMIGSPAFISPESIDGRSGSSRSDQYSLALTYYYLRTGSHAVHTSNQHAAIQCHLSGALDFSRVSAEEQNLLRRATSLDESGRFASCREFVAAIGRVAINHPEILTDSGDSFRTNDAVDTRNDGRCQSTTTPQSITNRNAVMARIDRINSLHQSGRASGARSSNVNGADVNNFTHGSRKRMIPRLVVLACVGLLAGLSLTALLRSNAWTQGTQTLGVTTAQTAIRQSVKRIVASPAETEPATAKQTVSIAKAEVALPTVVDDRFVESALDSATSPSVPVPDLEEQESVADIRPAPELEPVLLTEAVPTEPVVTDSPREQAIAELRRLGIKFDGAENSLELPSGKVDPRLFDLIEPMSEITTLNADGSELDDHDLARLTELLPNLQSLFLAGTRVTDIGLRSIAEWNDLTRLDLTSCEVSDLGLRHLESLSELHVVGLRETHVSGDGLEQLSETLHHNVVIQGPQFNLLGGKRIDLIR